MTNTLYYFDHYTHKYGWKVIPVYPNTKVPVGRGWNEKYDYQFARSFVAKNPKANLGILLGDIVDVEGDTPEANEFLNDVLKGYAHPSYSSNKSTHHLFLNPDPDLTALKVNGVEFRGHKHHSVIPPSSHQSGHAYTWDGDVTDVPHMPQKLLQFYQAHAKKKKKTQVILKDSYVAPLCVSCCGKAFVHKKRYVLEIEAFRKIGTPWLCHPCRRVRGIDVRPACRLLRREITQ